jgi:PhnB protein
MQTNDHGVPDGYHSITPYMIVPSADTLIAFLQSAFDAKLVQRVTRDQASDDDAGVADAADAAGTGAAAAVRTGGVAHAEVRVGNSMVMLCDATAEHPPATATLYLYVADADETYRQAMAAGARSLAEPADMPYGDRHGGVSDPAGNQWWIAMRLASSTAEPAR